MSRLKNAGFLWGLTLLPVLATCQTSDQMLSTAETDLNAGYVGRPLSDYMLDNGVVPHNAFDLEGRRVFIFGQPCSSWWHTRPSGTENSPGSFIVERVVVQGYCRTR